MKKTFLKPIYLLVMLILVACSKEENNIPDTSSEIDIPEVINGRLVFSSIEQMEKLISDKALLSTLEIELRKEGFTPLKNQSKIENQAYPDEVLNFYNLDGELQTGEDIIILQGMTQYIIKDNNETLFLKVKSDLEKGIEPKHKGLITHQIENIIPLEENQNSDKWLDARYQYRFTNSGGGNYKYVFEAYLNTFYFWGTVSIYTGVRVKLEWLHGNTWKPAADTVYKRISNLTIKVTPNFGGAQVKSVSFISQTNNQNLDVTGPPNLNSLIGSQNYHLQISGDFYAEINDPRHSYGFPWGTHCTWDVSIFI